MLPYYFDNGIIRLPSYGFMIVIGILWAAYMSYKVADRRIRSIYGSLYKDVKTRLPRGENMMDIIFTAILFGFIGGKLLHILPNLSAVLKNGSITDLISNGFVVYGSIIGGAIGVWLYCRLKKIDALTGFDNIMPFVSLAQGFGRIGCFCAGCCYGRPTDGPLGIVFTSEFSQAPTGIALFPTQLISSLGNFFFFVILYLISKKNEKRGFTTACYMLLYSVGRFIIEFYRGDSIRGFIGTLSTSQFISIFIFIFGVVLMIYSLKHKNNNYADIDIK